MRLTQRDFDLPAADVEFLDTLGRPWETVVENGKRWAIVHDWPLCDGYIHKAVSIAVDVHSGYPDTQLDMIYVYPAIQRVDGVSINALTAQSIRGEAWQRWSRHRTDEKPWRIGVDDLSTHLALADHWFLREFVRQN